MSPIGFPFFSGSETIASLAPQTSLVAPAIMTQGSNAGPLIDITYFLGKWYALQSNPAGLPTINGTVWVSPDLVNWTKLYSSTLFIAYRLQIINNILFILGNSASDNFVEYSIDGVNFLKTSTTGAGVIRFGAFINGAYFFWSQAVGNVYPSLSANPNPATNLNLAQSNNICVGLFNYNNNLYAISYFTSSPFNLTIQSSSSVSNPFAVVAQIPANPLGSGIAVTPSSWSDQYILDSKGNLLVVAGVSASSFYQQMLCVLNLNSPSGFSYPLLSAATHLSSFVPDNTFIIDSAGLTMCDTEGFIYTCPPYEYNNFTSYLGKPLPSYGGATIQQQKLFAIASGNGLHVIAGGMSTSGAFVSPVIYKI